MGSIIESFDPSARLLLEALLNTLWQGMLIAALVWLVLRFSRRASATTRHAVWLVSLLTICALPVIAIIAKQDATTIRPVKEEAVRPAVQTATPVASPVITPEANQPADSFLSDPFLIDSEIARLNSPVREIRPPARERINRDFRRAPQINDIRIAASGESTKANSTEAATSSMVEKNSLWQRASERIASIFSGVLPLLLVALWLLVCALMLWRVARSYRAVSRVRGDLGFVSSPERERVEQLAGIFGIKRRVQVFTSEQISMPMTIGSFKPLIILPFDLAASLSPAEFESVVAHELAHIKRWDYLTNFLQRIVQALLFFHPAVWFIGQQLMIERELACDDWVVKTCEPRRYASCLTKIVELLSESKPLAAANAIGGIIFGKHVISRRVEMILNRDRNATTAVSKPALVYSIGLVVMVVAVCSLISPVIAVPLGQKPAKQGKKESKPAATQPRVQELPPLAPLPPPDDRLMELPEPPDFPEAPEPPFPQAPSAATFAEPVFDLIEVPEAPAIAAPPRAVIQPFAVAPAAPVQPGVVVATPRPAHEPLPVLAYELLQDDKSKQPTIPETELLNVLVEIVKKDADPNVRNEALQGIYRLRSDAAINTLIQLYDGTSDVKVKGEIIGYLLRREGPNTKVDNSKAIAKLVSIARTEQNEELRNRAIRYLGNVKGDEGANNLIQIYDSLQDQKMKQYVIRSLAYNKSRKAIDKLIQIAKNDSDPVVRQYAIRSLYGIDSRLYLDFIDRERPRIGRLDGSQLFVTPRAFDFNGKVFEFDTKKWEEWQQNWQKKWEEQNEKLREMIDKMRIEGLDKLNLEELQNKLHIELPKIELHFKDLEDKIRLGHEFERIGSVESQLRSQLALVEAQIASIISQHTELHPKVAEARRLKNALERQLNRVRSMRVRTPRPAIIRRASIVSSVAPVASTASTSN
jgi:beta-lactamase regulating signal transducer with metallopeptidase domain